MACQGCGYTSETRLCCPTCIELGRNSYFCSQECFTKNWKAHAPIHALLKQNAEVNNGKPSTSETASTANGPVSTGSGGGPGRAPHKSLPQRPEDARGRGSVRSVPFGSTSLKNGQKMSTLPASQKGGANGTTQGAIGGFTQKAWSTLVSGAGSASAVLTSTRMTAFGESAQATDRGKVRNRSRSPAARSKSGHGMTGGTTIATPAKKKWSRMQMGLVVLTMLTFVGGALLWRKQQELDQDFGKAITIDGDIARAASDTAPVLVNVDSGVPSSVNLAASAVNAPNTEEAAAAKAENAEMILLQQELTGLRELVERHDKMLRYVMSRYVEKASPAEPAAGAPPAPPPPGYIPHAVEPVGMKSDEGDKLASAEASSSNDVGAVHVESPASQESLWGSGETVKRLRKSESMRKSEFSELSQAGLEMPEQDGAEEIPSAAMSFAREADSVSAPRGPGGDNALTPAMSNVVS